jgi:hypothetical protein
MTKNIFLQIEFNKNELDDKSEEELARELAIKLLNSDPVKNVQYRYGAFGKVDKVHARRG